MNVPHGINFDGEKYHLYFQYVPGVTKWESKIQWRHAVSNDLVQWQDVAPALIPLDDDVWKMTIGGPVAQSLLVVAKFLPCAQT